jgi:sulfide:quinone oxidoreductase
LAAQQADAAAETIAAAAGIPIVPEPFRPVLRGLLLVGREERYLRNTVGHVKGGVAADQPLWWPPTMVAGRYLAPYLFERDAAELLHAPQSTRIPVDLDLAAAASGQPGTVVGEVRRGGRGTPDDLRARQRG